MTGPDFVLGALIAVFTYIEDELDRGMTRKIMRALALAMAATLGASMARGLTP